MSQDTPVDPRNVTQPDAPTLDSAGKPVNVVQRDLNAVDEVITPTSIREKEQDVEELNKKSAEIERKVADGR